MKITETELLKQYDRAEQDWPCLTLICHDNGLPWFILHALGSVETGLVDGYKGIFNRIPGDVCYQSIAVVNRLVDLSSRLFDWKKVCNIDKGLGILDPYGTEVMERQNFLYNKIGVWR